MNIGTVIYTSAILMLSAGVGAVTSGEGRFSAAAPRALGDKLSEVLKSGGTVRTFSRLRAKMRRDREERELYEGISYLRNVAAIREGRELSVNWILEELAEMPGCLAPAYRTFLQLVRINEKEKGVRYFCRTVQAPAAKDYCRLLIQWDELESEELRETLLSFQKSLREIRVSRQKKWDEMISDIIYLPVVMNVMVVLINFIYIAYFIDQKEMLFTLM